VSIGSLYFLFYTYFSRVVLQNSREETLGEVKAWNPEVCGLSLVDPALNEVEPLDEVDDPGGHGFQTGVGHSVPLFRHFIVVNGIWQLLINRVSK
jgi:hypothetical protein